jgi:hypothetical protein
MSYMRSSGLPPSGPHASGFHSGFKTHSALAGVAGIPPLSSLASASALGASLGTSLSPSEIASVLGGVNVLGGPLGCGIGPAAPVAPAPAPAPPPAGQRRSLDGGSKGRNSIDNPAIASARAGPRIFIGKLTKDTSEADVKEYFSK